MLLDILRAAVSDSMEDGAGVVLSGGLDSSTVAMLTPENTVCFTGYYDVPGYDEREYAALIPRPHVYIEITPKDFVENFDSMLPHVPRPFQGPGTFGQYMVAKAVSQHTKVVLSGEGSDELFGGYARTLLAAGEPLPKGYENYKPPSDYPVDDLEEALLYDYDRLPDLLAVDEAMCGAWGIESRAPFTDDRVVDYALNLDPRQRVGKRHLRTAVYGLVPDEIINRRDKMGFPAPYAIWAQKGPMRSFIYDRIRYLPNPNRPFDREWWYDLLEASIG